MTITPVSDTELAALIAGLTPAAPPAVQPGPEVTEAQAIELLVSTLGAVPVEEPSATMRRLLPVAREAVREAQSAKCEGCDTIMFGAAARYAKCATCALKSTGDDLFGPAKPATMGATLTLVPGATPTQAASVPTPTTAYRVLVTGSRTWTDVALIHKVLDAQLAEQGDQLVIVHGHCPQGADAMADTWCQQRGVKVERHPADWDGPLGKQAGFARNQAMVDTRPDRCFAFIHNQSKGAQHTADAADAAGIELMVYRDGGKFAEPAPVNWDPPPSTVAEMRDVLSDLDANRPRSQQVALGPSELGTPCQRQVAMKLAGLPRQPDKHPPWAPMQGTAMHALMEEALRFHNSQIGRERWVIEERLHMDAEISGSGDAFDTDNAMVVDWKYTGSTALRKVKRKTVPVEQLVSPTYRVQAHLYGLGHQRAGRDVRWVRLVLLARSHDYDESAEWTERYQPDIALRALDRYYATQDLINALELANNPDLWPAVPAVASADTCAWCPFRRPGGPADATGCPGNTAEQADKQLAGLIA